MSTSSRRSDRLASRRDPYSRGNMESVLRSSSRAGNVRKSSSSSLSSKSSNASSSTSSANTNEPPASASMISLQTVEDSLSYISSKCGKSSGSGDADRSSSSSRKSYSFQESRKSSSSSEDYRSFQYRKDDDMQEGDSQMVQTEESLIQRIAFEEDGSVYRPDRERRRYISGPKHNFRGDGNRALKNSLISNTFQIETTRPEKTFYRMKEPKETETTLKQRALDKQEEEEIDNEMEVEAEEIGHSRFIKYQQNCRCECDCPHPDYWSEQMIADVHRNFYKLKLNGLQVPEEMVLFQSGNATMIRLHMNENTIWTDKALKALEFIDVELGYSGLTLRNLLNVQVFMMLEENLVVGCVVAEKANHGYRLVSKLEDEPMISNTPEPILCGINRMWVIPKYRRRRMFSFLLDYTRQYFFHEPLEKEYIGFSDPTYLGRLAIASYMEKSDFKVYFHP